MNWTNPLAVPPAPAPTRIKPGDIVQWSAHAGRFRGIYRGTVISLCRKNALVTVTTMADTTELRIGDAPVFKDQPLAKVYRPMICQLTRIK